MPSNQHEGIIELFRERPSLAVDLLGEVFGLKVPDHSEARIDSEDSTERTPTEYRADAVVTLDQFGPAMTVVVEVQRGRDAGKRWSWPVYLTTLRARRRCPAVLLVICTETRVARWCREPIDLGHPGLVLKPLVVDPSAIPVIADTDTAVAAPEMTVLSAMAHGNEPGRTDILEAVHAAFTVVDETKSQLYSDLVLAALHKAAARQYLEALMRTGTYEYQSDFAKRYVAEGKAEAILKILNARGVRVTDEARERITDCHDGVLLDEWIDRALVAESADDLFG